MMSRAISLFALFTLFVAATAAATAIGGCAERAPVGAGESDRLGIVVSIRPQVWLARRLAGERTDINVIVESGQSPETYRPTDAQVSDILRADVYFRLRLPFEEGPWFRVVRNASRLKIFDASDGIDRLDHNPHIWLTPKHLKRQADIMADAVIQARPSRRATVEANLESVTDELTETDRQLRRILAPLRGKRIYVYHPAWTYFASEYGFTEIAIEEHGKAPHDHRMTDVQKSMNADGARVIYIQPQQADAHAKSIADANNARVVMIDPLAEDILDNLVHVANLLVEHSE
jgi:zinc transport system substrate-binding protein